MKKILISVPYIYPICPLNFNHAKMFVVADVLNRYLKFKGYNVIFPVASHFTGNTAQKASKDLSSNNFNTKKDTQNLYRKTYSTPNYIIENFKDPNKLLDFYTDEIYWELKNIYVDCDYKHAYSTSHLDFSIFVKTMITYYKEHGLLIKNTKGDLALNYNDKDWKHEMISLLKRINVQSSFHKMNIESATKNIRNDWSLLRKGGFGVKYKKDWTVDPMFDSELFNIFDLYMIYKNDIDKNIKRDLIFNSLFDSLKTGKKSEYKLVNKILFHLPCNVFICEEHLKNWLVKKLYSESLLLHQKYQTKKFLILGMGLLKGKRMSASKGHSIFTRDLINQIGGIKTRVVILLSGGNISKQYNYDLQLVKTSKMLVKNLIDFILYLKLKTRDVDSVLRITNKELINLRCNVEKNIQKGYFRQALLNLTTILFKRYKNCNSKVAAEILFLYSQYLEILLPNFLSNF